MTTKNGLPPVFSREHVMGELAEVSDDTNKVLEELGLKGNSQEIAEPPSGGAISSLDRLTELREEGDRLLDLGLDLGYFACVKAVLLEAAPAKGYSAEEYDGA